MSEVTERNKKGINSFILRIYALVIMTIGMIFTFFPKAGFEWLTYLSWIAYPVFAFLIAEGFSKTTDKLKYSARLVVFVLLSEIPYNFLLGGKLIYPEAQNGMFTLLLGWITIWILDEFHKRVNNIILNAVAIYIVSFGAFWITREFNFQFYSFGIMFVVMFYISQRITYPRIMQFVILLILVLIVTSEAYITFTLGRVQYTVTYRFLTIFALIPIWFYNGKRGPNSLPLKVAFYAYWPLLLTILLLVKKL